MNKSFLLLPLSVAILTACSSNTQAPIENAGGSLSPGIMQPVDNRNAGGSWQPEIQQNSMPNNMGNSVPAGKQAPQPNFQPTYQPAAQTQTQTQTVSKTVSDCSGAQHVNVPRNPNTTAPDYSQIQKGSYKGATYKVNKGDTMFLIAYLAGIDVKELAALNNMSEPYHLSVGQTLKIGNCSTKTVTSTVATSTASNAVNNTPAVTYTPGANGTQIGSDGSIIGPVKSGAGVPSVTPTPTYNTSSNTASAPVATEENTTATNANVIAPIASNVAWQWPATGNIIQGFSNSDGGNKGIDIAGSRGQAVKAAAAGRVVYAGNALRGYGNLIIIKHNDDFLSAYAHNDKILVADQQEIKAGQEIAKMGSSGTNAVKLHFEIRYKGKSVDPTRYLPRH